MKNSVFTSSYVRIGLALFLSFVLVPTCFAWKPELGEVPKPIEGYEYLDGQSINLNQFKGKPTVLYFGGDWCPPCQRTRPYIVNLVKNHADIVNVVFISSDDNKLRDAKMRESKATGLRIAMPILSKHPAFSMETSRGDFGAFGRIYGYPTAMLLDKDGRVVKKYESDSRIIRNDIETDVMALTTIAQTTPPVDAAMPASDGSSNTGQIPYFDKTNDAGKAAIKAYGSNKSPKALAINQSGQIYWWGAEGQQAEISRRTLENCELISKSPCVLGAISEVVQKLNLTSKPVSAFAALGSQLDPNKVPFLSDAMRKSLATALDKARDTSPKYMALALNPRNAWFLKFDPEFKSQEEADNAALTACVNFPPPNRVWNRGACLLFAQGLQIVANLPLSVRFASPEMVKAAGGSPATAAAATARTEVAPQN